MKALPYPPRTSAEFFAMASFFRRWLLELPTASGASQFRTAMRRYAVQGLQLRKLGR